MKPFVTDRLIVAGGIVLAGLMGFSYVIRPDVVGLIVMMSGAVGLATYVLRAPLKTAVFLLGTVTILLLIAIPVLKLPADFGVLRVCASIFLVLVLVVFLIRVGVGDFNRSTMAVLMLYIGLFYIAGLIRDPSNGSLEGGTMMIIAVLGLALGASGLRYSLVTSWARVFVGVILVEVVYSLGEVVLSLKPLWVGAYITSSEVATTLPSDILPGFSRAQGTFGHPLIFSFFIVVALVATPHIMSRRFSVVTFAVLVIGLITTGSRSAFLIGLLVFLASTVSVKWLPFYLFLVAAGTIALDLFSTDVVRYSGDFVSTGSYTHRVGAFDAIPAIFARSTFPQLIFGWSGKGLSEAFVGGILQTDGLLAVDNQYVLLFLTTGFLGLFSLIAMLIWLSARTPVLGQLGLLMMAVYMTVFDLFSWPSSFFAAWILIGVCSADLVGGRNSASTEVGSADQSSRQQIGRGLEASV